MMMGKPPEPVPAHKAHNKMWLEINRMVLFIGACAAVALSVRLIERKASSIVLDSAS